MVARTYRRKKKRYSNRDEVVDCSREIIEERLYYYFYDRFTTLVSLFLPGEINGQALGDISRYMDRLFYSKARYNRLSI